MIIPEQASRATSSRGLSTRPRVWETQVIVELGVRGHGEQVVEAIEVCRGAQVELYPVTTAGVAVDRGIARVAFLG